MSSTTIGVKLDEATRQRLKQVAEDINRTPHWLIKQSIFTYLDVLEQGITPENMKHLLNNHLVNNLNNDLENNDNNDNNDNENNLNDENSLNALNGSGQVFLNLAQQVLPQSHLRSRITMHYRAPEQECLPNLIAQLKSDSFDDQQMVKVFADAEILMQSLRAQQKNNSIVQNLIQEFSLSSQEGIALMCLAEALLRIPDKATRDALIRDKISNGNWRDHLGNSSSLFVNAATWGLLISGKLVATRHEENLSNSLSKLIAKGGEPIIRKGVDVTMRLMGEQFVSGQTIGEAINHGQKLSDKGFNYSYDMLGEAALTEEDAKRYYNAYEQAINAIGAANKGLGIYQGSGISIKLSALYARYSRLQRDDTLAILYPRLLSLVRLAKSYDIGLNIDAEESERLELSLDLMDLLVREPDLANWSGIGFVVQAYQKRAPFVIDYLINLARESKHRLMIRLVKGAYWDSEIKKAQVDGQTDYPVYTRKYHTDVCYLACAKKMLQAPEFIYSQFATHNAMTVSAIMSLAEQYDVNDYEFQCLHGMGETLYFDVIERFKRPCRIYAPVGTHETLLPYLVRRLLENGANSSFVNQIANMDIPIKALLECPIIESKKNHPLGKLHDKIVLPKDLYGERRNSTGLDLYNEQKLANLSVGLLNAAQQEYMAYSNILDISDISDIKNNKDVENNKDVIAIKNPSNHQDIIGYAINTPIDAIKEACTQGANAFEIWGNVATAERADMLEKAADILEAQEHILLNLLIRESGKTILNAHAEIREAVDFLRYYAIEARQHFNTATRQDLKALGLVACISPWNFPLAIFLGQISAALAAGNTVIAKPAEQTPLIAARAIEILHQAGIPKHAVQIVIGEGDIGAELVQNPHVQAIVFTGSTEVAKIIQKQVAKRLNRHGQPVVLIAETGGQNAMIVDSSALGEQVVNDVIQSGFDSAGQRCSALRLLCVQEETADLIIGLLKGALEHIKIGNPEYLETDIGPVIDQEAKNNIDQHVAQFAKHVLYQKPLPSDAQKGTFCAPTIIEIQDISQLKREIFGPVLHILRYKRQALPQLVKAIQATGYGLTMGIHSRINESIDYLIAESPAGNIYANRNMVGAVVGVQPFGGCGLSGTGPKAGGELYLSRFFAQGTYHISQHEKLLAGPTGEKNIYRLHPKGAILCFAKDEKSLQQQLELIAHTGNTAYLSSKAMPFAQNIIKDFVKNNTANNNANNAFKYELFNQDLDDVLAKPELAAALINVDADILQDVLQKLANAQAKIVSTFVPQANGQYQMERLFEETSTSINTAAAGGNASLMTL